MAKTKLDRERQAIVENERLMKRVKNAERKERAADAIVVVELGNIATAVAVIRTRAVHIAAHCQDVRDELATHTGEDLTAAEAALTELEDEGIADLENFPEGWPN